MVVCFLGMLVVLIFLYSEIFDFSRIIIVDEVVSRSGNELDIFAGIIFGEEFENFSFIFLVVRDDCY